MIHFMSMLLHFKEFNLNMQFLSSNVRNRITHEFSVFLAHYPSVCVCLLKYAATLIGLFTCLFYICYIFYVRQKPG